MSPKGWTHVSGTPSRVFANKLKTVRQAIAEHKEEFKMLSRGLAEYPLAAAEQATRVLGADALDRAEKARAGIDWFLGLHRRIQGVQGSRRDNLVWAAVADAPPGFCHVRSTVVSALLDDIVSGLDFEAIRRRWAEKLHPLQYQRPTAAPTAGNIEMAERLFEKLGAASALPRRYARLADVLEFVWRPSELVTDPPRPGGLFGYLRTPARSLKEVELPPTKITWAKFARTVVPTALGMEMWVPASGNFYGLLTAANSAAPPILQWDGLAGQPRNPVSMYVYVNGSPATQWGIRPASWATVTALLRSPAHWQVPDQFRHHADQALFALAEARDANAVSSCLFPETLKAEYRAVRSVIEAHSNRTHPSGQAEGDANGLAFGSGNNLRVRVRTTGGVLVYDLDRWD